jgi:uncharacterized membrane protein YfcA
MKKVWKWILGIVLGLIVLAVLVGAAFMLRGNFHALRGQPFEPRGFSQRGPGMMPFGGYGYDHMRGPGMMSYGYRMNPLGGFIGGLFSLGFLALIVLGIIWLVRSLRMPKQVVVPTSASAVTPVETPVEMAASVTNPCKRCGQRLQDDWKVCPHCGKKV